MNQHAAATGPLSRLWTLDTPALSDALDRLGIDGQCVGLLPVDRGFRLAGPAFTVRMLPRGLTGRPVGDYIDQVAPGQVVVIDNGGRLDATVWGDILTTVASRAGVAGTVIDGVCRDTDCCVELGYPVYARSHTMRTGKDRVAAEACNQAVQLAGVRVEPGDWLVGDADGVLAIPAAALEDVLAAAEQVADAERRILAAVGDGESLQQARKRFHYHSLQTREEPR